MPMRGVSAHSLVTSKHARLAGGGPGGLTRRPMGHIATTASRASAAAPFVPVTGAASGSAATASASRAYSFLEQPESISSDETTTSVF